MKISRRVFELLRGHEIMTAGQTDGQTDGQDVYYRALPTSSGGALRSHLINGVLHGRSFYMKFME